MDACPDENEIASFAQGELDASARLALAVHVDECPVCQELLVELARVLVSDAPPPIEPSLDESGLRHVDPLGPTEFGAEDDEEAPPISAGLHAGDRLGRYKIVGHLGSGGMGSVYRAHDPQLGRNVALKVVLPVGDVAALRPRLVREARALAQVTHPNVVAVYDADVVDQRAFVVMELVDGHTVGDWLDAAPRHWRDVVALAQQAAEGLAAAHRAGLLHRDIKPANLLVGADGRLRVSDFGLVAAAAESATRSETADDDEEDADDKTEAGTVVGTPAYMAPEQLWGQPASDASDQFALCVVLYEALFGVRPYTGASVRDLRRAVALHGPPWPRRTNGVPDSVIQCILKGLAQQPEHRHSSMAELAHSLERAARHDADGHIRLNATLLAAACPMHIASSFYMLSRMWDQPALTMEPGAGIGFLLIAYIFCMIGWLLFGVLWAPANAYGLWHRRGWARTSTLIYATLCVASFIGAPYGFYALWSLTRPDVKAALSLPTARR